jgi:hypothetical protein
MTLPSDVIQQVQQRAGQRCEFWRMHQALQGATFHGEHILPESQGGVSVLENLKHFPKSHSRKRRAQAKQA